MRQLSTLCCGRRQAIQRGAGTLCAALALTALAGGPLAPRPALAHPLAPSLLELRALDGDAIAVLWKQPQLRIRGAELLPELPDSCKLEGEPALEPHPRARIERWRMRCPGGVAGRRFGVSGLALGQSTVVLRVVTRDGHEFQSLLTAGRPSLIVPERPTPFESLGRFIALGCEHLFIGLDHVLFVLALLLVIPSRRLLAGTLTCFTLGHSLTLALAAFGWAIVPQVVVEVGIAASLAVLAAEIAVGTPGVRLAGLGPLRGALLFGLLHGLGFAGALTQLGVPRADLGWALLGFNIGIELGQGAIVVAALTLTTVARRLGPDLAAALWPRTAAAYGIGSLAGYWAIERIVDGLRG